ncbi:MAG TPA: Hsp20/alpha crystallin family protein [Bryobacteraceae bacterium]|jgi:HSP20 family protein|nr:Hsp20/alpha crystallin family protein [Bryobacteraceae bacterium]
MTSTFLAGDARQTLDHFRRSVDQLFENFYGLPAESGRSILQNGSQWTFSPVMETAWGDSTLHLRAILPGVAQADLKVSVQNNQLILEGERKAPEMLKNNGQTQLAYGKFYAALTLPSGLNVDKLTCRLQDGILDIQIPVSEQMKPRQIQIQSGESRKSVSA